jgi:class 3 adenylate cyclase
MTFLFTDIVGSTRRWELDGERMAQLLSRHDEILSSAVDGRQGRVVKHTGDGLLAVFSSAADAIAAAVAGQRALAAAEWPGEPVQVRMGLHSGEAAEVDGDYFGTTLNRAARLMAVGWGGQTLCTPATVELAREHVAEGIGVQEPGRAPAAGPDPPVGDLAGDPRRPRGASSRRCGRSTGRSATSPRCCRASSVAGASFRSSPICCHGTGC